jgi:hypothetical protein
MKQVSIFFTILLFQLTAYPTTSKEIWNDLKQKTYDEFHQYSNDCKKGSLVVDSSRMASDDVNPLRTLVAVGSCASNIDEGDYRWIAVYESKKQTLIDRLVSRPSGYEIKWFGYIDAALPLAALIPSDIEMQDFDKDGLQEFHIQLKSNWADSKSYGPLILKKNSVDSEWSVYGVPPISVLIKKFLDGESLTAYPGIGLEPFSFFGISGSTNTGVKPPEKEKLELGIYEDEWDLISTSGRQKFITLRNGGNYSINKHPRQEYPVIRTVAFFNDDKAVMSPHYALVLFFKLTEEGIVVDELWNWGNPMISIIPLRAGDIHIDDIERAGVEAHETGNMYFGHTDFERR